MIKENGGVGGVGVVRFLFFKNLSRFLFFKNLGCRSCRGHFTLTNFSQTFPKYYPPLNFFGTSRRGAKKF